MPEYDSHHHVVKTTAQWKERAVEYWVVPRGCLCVELTPEHKTKLKVGEGNKYYAQLPYICEGHDLEDYYTKEEIDRLLDNLNRMAIQSTDEYDSKDDLPLDGNKLGDVRFVKSASPETKIDPDVYLWNGDRWIFVGYDFVEIDLSQYLKKEEFHSYFDPVSEKVDEMYPKMHTHENKSVLDQTERPYTIADKEKLDSLHNYDDTEIRELIEETGHTHWNKNVLDTITPDSLWTVEDRTKFESLHNYDDTELRNRMGVVESKAHTHTNKDILDQTTAPFKTEDKQKLDSLENYDVFVGTDGRYPGIKGLVPAPSVMDIGKFLSSSGEWELAGINTPFVGATPTTDGVIGLVPAPLMGEQSYYLCGDGTWAKVKSGGDKYKAGEGIYILSGEVATDTFPFQVYSRAGHLEQYIIYGNTGGVGDAMTGGVYGVNITITDEHGNSSNTSVILPEKISLGDYIDYGRQVFVHMRTNVSSLISSVDPSYNWRWAIRPDGSIQYTDIGAYGSSPQVTSLIELEPGITYELYHQCNYSPFANYMNLNVYDTEQNRTRTINFYDPVGDVPTIIALASNEKYIRLTYEHANMYPYTLIRVKAVETPITLPQIPLFPNSINTINVTNTIKPAEIYVEVAEPSEDDPDDPMSDFTGIIYNDGVLDITQEDPNNLYELTVHFRDDVDKVITIPETPLPIASDTTLGGIKVGNNLTIDPVTGVLSATGGGVLYDAGDGIEFTYNHIIDMLFDRTAFLNSITSVQRGTITKDTVTGAFTLTATGNDAYTSPDRSSLGTVYSIQADPNTTYKLTWTSDDPTVHGNVFVFENGDIITSYLVDQATSNELTFITSSTCQTLNFRFGVQNSGNSLTYSDISLYKITGDSTINAKLGNGLQFDANGAIETTSTEYTAGTGIDIGGSIIYNKHRAIPSDQYREVLYIDSDGTNYIMTDLTPASDTAYQLFWESLDLQDLSTQALLGTDTIVNGQHRNSAVFYEYYNNTVSFAIMSGNDSAVGTWATPVDSYLFNSGQILNAAPGQRVYQVFTCTYNNTGGYSNTTVRQSSGIDYSGKTNPQPFAIFGANTYDSDNDTHDVVNRSKYRYHWFVLFRGNQIQTEYITHVLYPCYRLSDGRIGVYDINTSVFYPANSNSGFTLGADLVDIVPDTNNTISAKIGRGLTVDPIYGNITNAGVIDVKQSEENPSTLTVEFVGSQKNITIPGSNYVEGDAISIEHPQISSTITHVKWVLLNTRNRSSTGDIVQVGEFELYDTDDQLLTYSSISTTFGNGGTPTYDTNQYQQTPDKLIDGDISLKMCCTNFTTSCLGLEITMELMDPIDIRDIKQYRYITANDQDVRDPVTWDLYVSSDGTDWTLVDRQVDDSTIPTARETSTAYYEITHPTSDDLAIGVKYGNGLRLDANGALEVIPGGGLTAGRGIEIDQTSHINDKLGVGLTFDSDDAVTLDETTDLVFNCDYSE